MSETVSITTPVLELTDDTPATEPTTAACTNAVLAICVVFVPNVAVGAVGVPVSAGLALGASNASAASARAFSAVTDAAVATPPVYQIGQRDDARGADNRLHGSAQS
jgi:hypothetical protein